MPERGSQQLGPGRSRSGNDPEVVLSPENTTGDGLCVWISDYLNKHTHTRTQTHTHTHTDKWTITCRHGHTHAHVHKKGTHTHKHTRTDTQNWTVTREYRERDAIRLSYLFPPIPLSPSPSLFL